MIDPRRVRILKDLPIQRGAIVYWMSRDQRCRDNWALIYAQQLALSRKSPLIVIFCLVRNYLGASQEQYRFMLKGLEQVELSLKEKNIGFCLLQGDPATEIPRFLE